MPRKRRGELKRGASPDPKYGDALVQKLMNHVMNDGKKSVAEGIVYGAFKIIAEKMNQDPLVVFHQGVENVKPLVETRSRRVGGATYQVPVEIRSDRQIGLALKWIIGFARKRKGRPMKEKLAEEIMDAYYNRGASVKKKDEVHRMAEANRAFAHYRW